MKISFPSSIVLSCQTPPSGNNFINLIILKYSLLSPVIPKIISIGVYNEVIVCSKFVQ